MTTIKYVHVRFPGCELIHFVPAHGLKPDDRFGGEPYIRGFAKTLCGKTGSGWIIGDDKGATCCPLCSPKR